MPRLDRPGTTGDGRRGVHHGEVELRPLREQVEQRGPVRSRLGRNDRHSKRLAVLKPTRLPRRDTSTGAQPLLDHLRSKRRRELRHLVEQLCASERFRCSCAHVALATVPSLEFGEQGDERAPRLLPRAVRNRLHGCEPPREVGVCRRQVWRDPRDLAQRDLTLERLLQFPPSQRSLARMDALVDEDLAQVVALRELEHPRPQVVVLALEERGVVPKRVALEELAVDEHCRMEEGRAEQRMPAQGARPVWHEVHPTQLPIGIDVPDARPDDPELRLCLHPRQLALEPLGRAQRRPRPVARRSGRSPGPAPG